MSELADGRLWFLGVAGALSDDVIGVECRRSSNGLDNIGGARQGDAVYFAGWVGVPWGVVKIEGVTMGGATKIEGLVTGGICMAGSAGWGSAGFVAEALPLLLMFIGKMFESGGREPYVLSGMLISILLSFSSEDGAGPPSGESLFPEKGRKTLPCCRLLCDG